MTRFARMVLLAAAVAGCSLDTGQSPGTDVQVFVLGRFERGLNIVIEIHRGDQVLRGNSAIVHFSPLEFVAPAAGSSFQLLRSGTLTISVNVGDEGSRTFVINVADPPKFLFDMSVAGNRDVYRASLDGLDLEQLTFDAAVDAYPTSAKDNLTFTSYRNGNGELYSRSLCCSVGESRLSTTSANETDGQLSRDGQFLAYTRDDGGTTRVWLGAATNSDGHALTSASGSAVEGRPYWRFTSDSVVFMSMSQGTPSIFREGRTGSSPALVAKPATVDSSFAEPTWSADGATIAFAAKSGTGPSRIAVYTRATNATAFVTPATINASQPVFLADGRIVFRILAPVGSTSLGWVDPREPGNVFVVPLTGTNPEHPAIIWP